MELSNEKVREYIKRLLLSRMRILCNNGFYGLLLMHTVYSIDEKCETAYTDGERIAFNPQFLERLSNTELDFVMMHEILHIVLQHCIRGRAIEESERFNIACDIVVNSNILLSNNMDFNSITISFLGQPSMHLAPDGREGYEYTAEQVYNMLPSMPDSGLKLNLPGSVEDGDNGEDVSEGDGEGDDNSEGDCGCSALGRAKKKQCKANGNSTWDDHSKWGMLEDDDIMRDVWVKRFEDACEAISVRDPSNSRGLLPAFAKRILKELRRSQTDWKTVLNNFVQEEITDYSFNPPDRRFSDSPFFLPDFNAPEDTVKNILFMVDTSGSMSDDMVTAAYSEIKGAIDQFNGRLKGWLGFFDAAIIEPKPFDDEHSFRMIKPAGGGGTDFQIIFEYVSAYMSEEPPASIIILTDGYAPFPKEELSMNIPVLWLLNNENVNPPWGKVARITV